MTAKRSQTHRGLAVASLDEQRKRAALPQGQLEDTAMQANSPMQGYFDMFKSEGGLAGPLSKVEYKSAGGETYKLSYGGPISKGV